MRFSPASGLASRSPPPARLRASFCSLRSTGLGRPTCAPPHAPPLQPLHAPRGQSHANLFQVAPACGLLEACIAATSPARILALPRHCSAFSDLGGVQ